MWDRPRAFRDQKKAYRGQSWSSITEKQEGRGGRELHLASFVMDGRPP